MQKHIPNNNLIPKSETTRGHGTHSLPAIWGDELVRFMKELR
jgi:hypothetical protein